ncbi:hypothetical protein FS749_005446 [Ceratobasidium sp. UAMH 11750]|nr:hypothetical protein FS749_005446 [Ceratobasidium sp. UAMH 11750]
MGPLDFSHDLSDAETYGGTYDQYLQEQEAFVAIPGPQLPNDPVDAIYDDYAGDLSCLGDVSTPKHTPKAEMDPAPRSPSFNDPFNLWEASESEPLASAQSQGAPFPTIPIISDPEGWFPWKNEADCLLTAMSGFPRAVFSQSELQVLAWFSERLGISGLSSMDQLKSLRARISGLFGSTPRLATSALGNIFSHNSLETIIAHEIANPITSANLATYPEDAGPSVKGALHGAKWREEVDGTVASPMARLYAHTGAYQDYFVDEPALVKIGGNVTPVLVSRWFTRAGSLVANVHQLIPLTGQDGYAVDGGNCLEVPQADFHLALPEFRQVCAEYSLPPPDQILFLWPGGDPVGAIPWMEPVENPWRAKANGKEVLSVPILGYCDDTSGNQSKKWNKHNSYLFVLAGLPQEAIHSPYHVHFLATSNIASPLEMLEAIASESEKAAREGIWAYSAIKRDLVLCIAWWLALEGDNPMQSELSSHIGMGGKCFCRVCQVRGKDKQRPDDLGSEKQHIREFMNIAPLRSREGTVDALSMQLDEFMAKRFTASENLSTETGVKDKYLNHFIGEMKAVYNKTASSKRLTAKQGQVLLSSLRTQLPKKLFNPALYLPNLDVTQDTPVEVLHVVLLGITKYFWRDAVSRQDNNHRSILIARLNSFDTAGLGISRLDGKTLVQHAKSLTGGNFRDILQVAPAVLYDLLEPRAYAMWTALCSLAPLIFQPEIDDICAYMAALEARIDRLLLATVMCNPQWFNKPKFHVLLHLPKHVQEFGPPSLYATETFESYNFVIRLRSIYSNRQAPSADIGRSFSLMHALRHLVSGGFFQYPSTPPTDGGPDPDAPWVQAGPKVQALLHDKMFLKFMGLSKSVETDTLGICVPLPSPHGAPVPWASTRASILQPGAPASPVLRCRSVKTRDDSTISIHNFILVRVQTTSAGGESQCDLVLAQILEILSECLTHAVLAITVKPFDIGTPAPPYHFPTISPSQQDAFIPQISDILTAVSVFHNCAKHKCSLAKLHPRRQERQVLDSYEDMVQHSVEPNDLVLNLAQLRSAETLHNFYPNVSPAYPTLDDAITDGLEHQAQLESERQANQVAKEAAAKERARKKEEKEERQAKRQKTGS